MLHRARDERVGSDWALRATWHEYQLSPDSPVFAAVRMHPRPTPLRIDLHEGVEVGLLLRGEQERRYEDGIISLGPGDVWLQPMWEPHGWRTLIPDTESVLLVFLPEFLGEEMLGQVSWLSPFAVPPRQRPRVADPATRAITVAVGKELAQEIRAKRRGWVTAVRLGLLRLLFVLSRDWEPPASTVDATQVRATNLSRVMPAVALIQDRRPGTVTLDEAAEACGLSRSRFGSVFRQTMGTSFGQFALRARVAYAAHRLLTTDLPSETIAWQTGFVDGSHFHRTFLKHYGCTPREYRARGG